jgi:hypothetical protein
MPAIRLLPDKNTLQRWLAEGLTHQQMADRVHRETGNKVSRSSVSAAIHRHGLSTDQRRYSETLPWRVKVAHIREYPARMLRLLGRRLADGGLNSEESRRLDSWLSMLEAEHAVVGYDPNSPQGFYYVEKNDRTDGLNGMPIRVQEIKVH